MKWYQSVKVQVSILIVIINTVILTIFGGIDYYNTKNQMLNDLKQLSENMTTRLSKQLAIPVWSLDKKQTAEAIMSEMMDKRIYGIIVTDIDDSIFVGKVRDNAWHVVDCTQKINGKYVMKSIDLFRDGKRVGVVESYITQKFLKEKFRSSILAILIQVTVLDLVIFLSMFLLINNKIIKHLKTLTAAAEKISTGEMNTDLKLNVKNEIGQLAEAIDRMKSSLRVAMDRIKR